MMECYCAILQFNGEICLDETGNQIANCTGYINPTTADCIGMKEPFLGENINCYIGPSTDDMDYSSLPYLLSPIPLIIGLVLSIYGLFNRKSAGEVNVIEDVGMYAMLLGSLLGPVYVVLLFGLSLF